MSEVEKENRIHSFALEFLERQQIVPNLYADQIIRGYKEGYHQAEQDLALTWEDMMIIHKCIKDAMNYKLYKMMEGIEGQKEVYEEVLKRFKEIKK